MLQSARNLVGYSLIIIHLSLLSGSSVGRAPAHYLATQVIGVYISLCFTLLVVQAIGTEFGVHVIVRQCIPHLSSVNSCYAEV